MLLLALALLAASLGGSIGGRPKAQRWVKIWGGPTEGPTPIQLRLELVDTDPVRAGAPTQTAELIVEDSAGARMVLPIAFDSEGAAFVQLPKQTERTLVQVQSHGERLATGTISLTREAFWQRRSMRGGWLRGRIEGDRKLSVGCRDGVLALGQPSELGVAVSNALGMPEALELLVELEGLETIAAAATVIVHSDAQGQAMVPVIAKDLAASIRVTAGIGANRRATFYSSIPIERSTLRAGLRDGRIVADSLIPLLRAYYSLVNADGRWAAGAIELLCDSTGQCHGEVPLENQPSSPAWLMLGTEPALDGPNVVGWPVATTARTFVSESVVVKDQLLLDGRARVLADAASDRARRFSRVVVAVGLAALLLCLAIVLPWLRSRRESRALASQWPEVHAEGRSDRRPVELVGVLLLVLVGLGALILWARGQLMGG